MVGGADVPAQARPRVPPGAHSFDWRWLRTEGQPLQHRGRVQGPLGALLPLPQESWWVSWVLSGSVAPSCSVSGTGSAWPWPFGAQGLFPEGAQSDPAWGGCLPPRLLPGLRTSWLRHQKPGLVGCLGALRVHYRDPTKSQSGEVPLGRGRTEAGQEVAGQGVGPKAGSRRSGGPAQSQVGEPMGRGEAERQTEAPGGPGLFPGALGSR